jgi:Plasmid pRiA4b ORF-3-like protein
MPELLTITEPVVYRLRVVLRGVSPLIWRRLLVRGDSTIADLHATPQIVLGWSDEHLNRFVIHGREYGVSHLGGIAFRDDPRQVDLADLGLRVRERIVYEYDFTDGWQHEVRIEQILPLVPGRHYPLCIGGRRRVPPEDCGGPWAFLELRERYTLVSIAERLSALAQRRLGMGYAAFIDDHYDDVRELQRWLEIDRFDRRAVNRRLAERAVAPMGSAA